MSRLVVGPFNRVEGDLEVTLDTADGAVRAATVTSPMYRGFEQILAGRAPLDVLTIVPRICGICSVSQSMAASAALRAAAGVEAEPNGVLAANLVHAAENIADHLTHSFMFFLPDFAHESYRHQPWHGHAVAAYGAGRGRRSRDILKLRARLLHVVGILAGKWPHSLALQPGGTTVVADTGTKARLLAVLGDVRHGLEREVFGAPLEDMAALDTTEALAAYATAETLESSDLRFFLALCDALDLHTLGRVGDPHISFGAYEGPAGEHLFARGTWTGTAGPLDLSAISEDPAAAWLAGPPLHPAAGETTPDPDKANAYSWCKAPRLDGKPAQVGALARQLVAGQPLLRALATRHGSTVATRVLARFLETARLVPAMEQWVRALRPGAPFCAPFRPPRDGTGAGLVEAARGALGHWLEVRGGLIHRYQIIAPTTWNFSPRDGNGVPGPLERALVGTPVGPAESTPVAVQHVVRSFDPCMVCTVH